MPPLFLCPKLRRNCAFFALLITEQKNENKAMEELLKKLEQIGFTPDTCDRIRERYDGDEDGLTRYVLYCIALFDDRHEYVS